LNNIRNLTFDVVKPILYISALIVLVVVSCKQPNQDKLDALVERGNFKKSELVKFIEKKVNDTTFMNGFRFGDTLVQYYNEHKYKPAWAMYLVDDSMAEPVLNRIFRCREEGFRPSYYKYDSIRAILSNLKIGEIKSLYGELALLELLVADNMLSLHYDRVVGRTDPEIVLQGAYHLPKRKHEDFALFDVMDYKDFSSVLDKASLQDTAYVYLQDLLLGYLKRIDAGEQWEVIDTTGVRKLEPGDTTTLLPAIAKKMNQIQVISEVEMLEADSNTYNKSYAKYVRRFQQRYGLYDDAIFGRNTFGLLNESMQDRINQISANMERIRWFKFPEEKPYISVNLPAFELTLHYEDSIKKMATCIGKPRPYNYNDKLKKSLEKKSLKPADHETPQIYSRVAYMVVNPTWNVPRSIITREMWWKMKTDSHYLADAGYGVFYKKKEVRSDTINWRKYNPSKLPFEIIQKSGPANALGKVKFIFPNKYSIYLHDTPQKSKFKWSGRAVSHGCVRVENPLLLGEFLTQKIDTLDADDFRIHMGYEPQNEERLKDYDAEDTTTRIQPLTETRIIRLNEQLPVFFLYNTIFFDEDWNVQYRNDVYDKNKFIIEGMNF
jgi:murein L,D-transpeptidase YcbB/YkuD